MEYLILGVPFAALIAFIGGIYLIIHRHKMPWFLWVGIALVGAFILTLPLTVPVAFLLTIFFTGGNFS